MQKNGSKEAKHIDFSEGSVGKKMLFFSIPIIAGMMLQTAYNIIDTVFVGMLGPYELAAVSLAFPVVFIFIALASGLGIGANSLISQAVGKRDFREANNLSEHALVIGVVIGALIAALGIIFSPHIFSLMGADENTLPLAVEYSVPIFVGLIFMFIWYISDSILKSQGDSKTPMKTLAISVAANVVLDPLLIFGLGPVPAFGLAGAAYATLLARILGAALNFRAIYGAHSKIDLALKAFRPHPEYIKKMFIVGLPASGSNLLNAGGFMFLTAIAGSFGAFAIAAFGIGQKINSLVIMPLVGLSSAVVTFTGQNLGAGKVGRAKEAVFFTVKISFILTLLAAACLLMFPEAFIRVFSQDPEVLKIGVGFLSIVPFAFIFYSIHFIILGAFQGAGKTQLAFFTGLAYWVVTVIAAHFLSGSMGLDGVWYSMVGAAFIELIAVLAIYFSGIWVPKELREEK